MLDHFNRNIRSWWLSPPGLLLLAGMLSSAAAWWLIAAPVALLANVDKHTRHFPLVYTHMAGGTVMLILGAANLYIGSTRRFFAHHKIVGYTYLLGGSVGATLAIVLALGDFHRRSGQTVPSDIGIALASLGAAWLIASAMALRAARNGQYGSHRAWMIRSYVLTWSFVLCRLVGRVPVISDIGDGAAIVWLSWIGPLFLCEVALQWNAGAHRLTSGRT